MVPNRLPKLFVVRHGETEWTINGTSSIILIEGIPVDSSNTGRHTGTSDIPLTKNGETLIRQLGEKAAGVGKLIDPQLISKTFVSPRIRAQKTFELLFENSDIKPAKEIDERVREWTYGDYEGLFLHEIEKLRRERGLASEDGWDIWMQGCEGGESVTDMISRADSVVKTVKEIHAGWINGLARGKNDQGGDILVVSHGHFSKCLVARWLNLPLETGRLFSLDPGGVCVLGYSGNFDNTQAVLDSMNLGLL